MIVSYEKHDGATLEINVTNHFIERYNERFPGQLGGFPEITLYNILLQTRVIPYRPGEAGIILKYKKPSVYLHANGTVFVLIEDSGTNKYCLATGYRSGQSTWFTEAKKAYPQEGWTPFFLFFGLTYLKKHQQPRDKTQKRVDKENAAIERDYLAWWEAKHLQAVEFAG
mgnify:CR=1 FL=1